MSLCNLIWCKPLTLLTQIIWYDRIQSFKYLRSTTLGCSDIGIIKSEFVTIDSNTGNYSVFKENDKVISKTPSNYRVQECLIYKNVYLHFKECRNVEITFSWQKAFHIPKVFGCTYTFRRKPNPKCCGNFKSLYIQIYSLY